MKQTATAVSRLAGGTRRLLNGLLPPLCLACDRLLTTSGLLCADCWSRVDFIAPPLCRICGYPFAYDTASPGQAGGVAVDLLCGACLRETPAFDRARAVMRYDDLSRRLLLSFKHGDRLESVPAFAHWMARAGHEQLDACDLVTVVPLHWTRLFARRYNQAALLGRGLVKQRPGLTFLPDLLLRTRRTPSQGRLGRTARQRNVAGAFRVNPRRGGAVVGQRVLLIDDVMTTGATVEACCKALRKAGAETVEVLVLARVVRGEV